jgi:P27 family predicted phage terminase small subunit
MGARGPLPTPTRILQLRGSRRARDRVAGGEPQPDALEKLPPCPKRLKGEARKLWKVYGGQLIRQSLLTELDLGLLEDLCQVQARLLKAEEQLDKFGEVLVSDQGGMYQSPYLAIVNKCMAQLQVLRDRFGMGPAARPRVRTATPPVSEEPPANDKSRFFRDFMDRPRPWEEEEEAEADREAILDVINKGGA